MSNLHRAFEAIAAAIDGFTAPEAIPEKAVENLQRAGLLAPDLPEPNDPNIFLFVPDGKGWITGELEALGPLVWTAPGGRVMVQRVEPGELTPDDAQFFALTVLAAAQYAKEKQ